MYEELWSRWSECHSSVDQQKRIESAKKSACTPVLIDQTTGIGHFKGSSGNHTTYLDRCSCVDFNRRKLPCKHMYRLAMEFNLLEENFHSDSRAIIEPGYKRSSLIDTVKIVESLTEAQQRILLELSKDVNSKNPVVCSKTCDDLRAIIDSGIIFSVFDASAALALYKKTELIELAASLELSLPKGLKKKEIADFIITNSSEPLSSVELLYTPVQFAPNIKYGKLHMYLHRKYDTTISLISFQEGFCPIPLLDTELPDDDVTAVLRDLGYYKK